MVNPHISLCCLYFSSHLTSEKYRAKHQIIAECGVHYSSVDVPEEKNCPSASTGCRNASISFNDLFPLFDSIQPTGYGNDNTQQVTTKWSTNRAETCHFLQIVSQELNDTPLYVYMSCSDQIFFLLNETASFYIYSFHMKCRFKCTAPSSNCKTICCFPHLPSLLLAYNPLGSKRSDAVPLP